MVGFVFARALFLAKRGTMEQITYLAASCVKGKVVQALAVFRYSGRGKYHGFMISVSCEACKPQAPLIRSPWFLSFAAPHFFDALMGPSEATGHWGHQRSWEHPAFLPSSMKRESKNTRKKFDNCTN